MGRFTVRVIDGDGDLQQTSVETVTPTSASFDQIETDEAGFVAAIEAIILGNVAEHRLESLAVETGATPPATMQAQTNIQWVAEYIDTVTNERLRWRIGTADLGIATVIYNNAPALNLAAGAGLAFKNAFDGFVRHDGNTVDLQAVYYRE